MEEKRNNQQELVTELERSGRSVTSAAAPEYHTPAGVNGAEWITPDAPEHPPTPAEDEAEESSLDVLNTAPHQENGPAEESTAAQVTADVGEELPIVILEDDEPKEADRPSGKYYKTYEDPPPKAEEELPFRLPRLMCTRKGTKYKGRKLVKKDGDREFRTKSLSPQQRLLLLDTWQRSGLPASDFAALVGLSKHTLWNWKKKFDEYGPAGLADQPRGGPKGSRLPEITKRTILMIKERHPEFGCQRISDMLLRGPALPASPQAVSKVLHEAGYEFEEVPTRPHPDKKRRFERAKPNQLWQTDLFTFILKRQNRRVYLVFFMDDHSRFIVGYGIHASASTELVLECLRAAITSYGAPEEILTDNGTQYKTWRGKSRFTKELEKRGIKQIVARPRHPQTLGKAERFWGTLWRECVETAVFLDLGDARKRIGLFIDYYNFKRPHQGIGKKLVPADRFFGAAPEVLRTLKARVAANALELARGGVPKPPFYVTGQVEGKSFSLHAEGERMILTPEDGDSREVDLVAPDRPDETASEEHTAPNTPNLPESVCPHGSPVLDVPEDPEPAPGTSPLDGRLDGITESLNTKSRDADNMEGES
jgi:transposase InsO family protein